MKKACFTLFMMTAIYFFYFFAIACLSYLIIPMEALDFLTRFRYAVTLILVFTACMGCYKNICYLVKYY